MRIISGSLKGRNILTPRNFKGRPTTDFAREGLFNVLNNLIDFDEMAILDLFAGTGAFGLECISRGASSAIFVEIQSLHVKSIAENFRAYEISNASTVRQDVFKFLKMHRNPVDLVFADPPYELENLMSIPELVLQPEVLVDGGIFVLEHGKGNAFSEHPHFLQERSYGSVRFSFFQRSV